MVPLAGVEPARFLHRGILSPVRLPIPPQRQRLDYILLFYEVQVPQAKKLPRRMIFRGRIRIMLLSVRPMHELRIKGQCPQTRYADNSIYYAADYRCLASEDRRYDIELEKAYQKPVHSSDYNKRKCCDVHICLLP